MGVPSPQPPPRIPVCGIGASAGGVEALQQFFRELPSDLDLAYIVVVHLSPDHKSELPAILAQWTTMPVFEVADHDQKKLAPNHVYVIGPNRKLEITDSSVAASPFTQPRGQRTAIDLFFRSLAFAHGDGFAVVLSGSGSDGAVGAKAIKERGGLVLVQDPDEAAYSGMPSAAIATGVADVVLPIPQLVTRLAELARNKHRLDPVIRAPEPPEPIPQDEGTALARILEVLRARTGHDFSGYKPGTVLRRVSRRMQLSDHLTLQDYLPLVRNNAAEAHALFNDLLISVTTFFRDPGAWDSLRTHVITPLVATTPAHEAIRVWVPACATGEEAYTLAMLFCEEFDRHQSRRALNIFATDMDAGALAVARDGIYPQAIDTDLSDERLDRYFRHDGEHYRVVAELRDHVVFAAHNLLRDPPFSRLQLISCRNVLIYLDRQRQAQVMNVFRYACGQRGHLFLGSAESADSELFEPVDASRHVYRVRADSQMAIPHLSGPASHRERDPGMPDERRDVPSWTASELHVAALEAMSPPTVLLDDRWNVVHLSSTASRFFQQGAGPVAKRATDLVRSELRHELHALLTRAAEDASPHLSSFVSVRFDDSSNQVAILAQQRPRSNGQREVLLTFLDVGPATDAAHSAFDRPAETVTAVSTQLHQAERRIEDMHEEAVLATEKLRASNEELQSLNEEYRSTTEELETSKEELQSTNEELQTINQELKLKVDELSRAHSNLQNLMAATNVATLFLSLDLRITWYSQQLTDLFTIRPRDLDRPVGDIRHTLDYHDLESDSRTVLATLTPIERHTTSADGRVYIARVSPYRSVNDPTVDGVVITFVDVTELVRTDAALRDSQQRLEMELAVMRRLHAMTLEIGAASTLGDALEQLVAAAMELHGADQGHIQLYDADAQRLEIAAQVRCTASFLTRFASVTANDSSIFGQVLRRRAIAQIADVAAHEHDPSLRRLAVEAGYHSVQSTPLVNRDGDLLGVLSVHFAAPHEFTERDLQLSTLLGRQAAEVLDARLRQLQVSASKVETDEIRKLLGRLVVVQEEERRRVARDVHDQLGQPMTALRMQIEAVQTRANAYASLASEMERTMQLAEELDRSIDFLTWELRPAALDRLGLSAALSDLVDSWSERFAIAADYHGDDDGHDGALPASVSVNVYRVVQEALHNIHKHARATRVSVLFTHHGQEATIVIEDNGQGFTPERFESGSDGRLGLVSMRERAHLIGGTLAIESTVGRGTSVFLRVPYATSVTVTDAGKH